MKKRRRGERLEEKTRPSKSRLGIRPNIKHVMRKVQVKAQPLLDRIPTHKLGILQRLPFLNRSNGAWEDLDAPKSRDNTRSMPPSYEKSTVGKSFFAPGKPSAPPVPQIAPPPPNAPKRAYIPIVIPEYDGRASSHYSTDAGVQTMSTNTGAFLTSPSEDNATMRSRMPDPFFNQSELARQPSDAYDPTRRQVNRVSALSSLSSGFGDGDIVVGTSSTLPIQSTKDLPTPADPNPPPGRPSSWTSRRTGTTRESTYTESSEDSPPKFRSVSSWVNQQTGRLKRAAQREPAEEDVPPVPDVLVPGRSRLPPEEQLNMMADDGQEPRRPDDMNMR
jgi:hypothetical protein